MPFHHEPAAIDAVAITVTTADCTVVIPTYNERENIEPLIARVLEQPRYRILVVAEG